MICFIIGGNIMVFNQAIFLKNITNGQFLVNYRYFIMVIFLL